MNLENDIRSEDHQAWPDDHLTETPQLQIHTDGACSGNPGPGGCAAILICGPKRKELHRPYRWTTSNRMELMALIMAMEELTQRYDITVHTDSKYVAEAFNAGWLANWRRNGWRTASGKPVRNIDLWRRLEALVARQPVAFNWVRGHSGHPENEHCDQLARAACRSSADDMWMDMGYEAQDA